MKNKLTEEEINEAEDFGQLLKKHQRFVKKKKWIVGGVIAAGVFLLGSLFILFQEKNIEYKEPIVIKTESAESFINKPFEIEEIKDTFVFNNQLGDTLHYRATDIIVPANALVDSLGNSIKGIVSITYEEFHTPVEAFVSGIPMKYDSGGIEFHFETAGMFDIRGFSGTEPVFIAKPIEVRLASRQLGDYFNKYFFDEDKGRWEFLSKDTAIEKERISEEEKVNTKKQLKQIENAITAIKKNQPQKKKTNSVCIKLDVDSTEFPEFQDFKEVLFELDDNEKVFKKEFASIEWDDAKLKRSKEGLELHIFDNFKKSVLKVRPVYDGKAYAEAISRFESITLQKSDSLLEKKKELKNKIKGFSNEVKLALRVESFVTRIFQVNQFGIYNCDFPQKMPKGQLIVVEYLKKSDNPKKDTLKLRSLYLVEENSNTLYTLNPRTNLSFNPNNKSVLWGVTMDNKLAIFKSDYFEKIPRNYEGIYNLEFDLIEKDLYTKDTIVKELDIEALL